MLRQQDPFKEKYDTFKSIKLHATHLSTCIAIPNQDTHLVDPSRKDSDWLMAHHPLNTAENTDTSEGGGANIYLCQEVTISQVIYQNRTCELNVPGKRLIKSLNFKAPQRISFGPTPSAHR